MNFREVSMFKPYANEFPEDLLWQAGADDACVTRWLESEMLRIAKINEEIVDEVIMGCGLPAAIGQAPARQACLGAGLPKKVECLTINKVVPSRSRLMRLITRP